MTSRSINDLLPPIRDRAIEVRELFDRESAAGESLLIYCTWRSEEDQAILYRRARSRAQIEAKAQELAEDGYPLLAEILMAAPPQFGFRRRRTNSAPGESFHQHRIAFDAVPLVSGKPVWGTTAGHEKRLWHLYGECAEAFGMQWSGRWTGSLRETAHVQYLMNLNLKQWMERTYSKGRLVA